MMMHALQPIARPEPQAAQGQPLHAPLVLHWGIPTAQPQLSLAASLPPAYDKSPQVGFPVAAAPQRNGECCWGAASSGHEVYLMTRTTSVPVTNLTPTYYQTPQVGFPVAAAPQRNGECCWGAASSGHEGQQMTAATSRPATSLTPTYYQTPQLGFRVAAAPQRARRRSQTVPRSGNAVHRMTAATSGQVSHPTVIARPSPVFVPQAAYASNPAALPSVHGAPALQSPVVSALQAFPHKAPHGLQSFLAPASAAPVAAPCSAAPPSHSAGFVADVGAAGAQLVRSRLLAATGLQAVAIICVLGGTEFKGEATEEIVREFAARLGASPCPGIVVTGGMKGVQQTFARHCGDGSKVWNLLPVGGSSGYGVGTDIHAGANLDERKLVFGQLGDVYVTFEGGPGVAQEARDAAARGAFVVPLARTGGASSGMFDFPRSALERPPSVSEGMWGLLFDSNARAADSASAAAQIVLDFAARTAGGSKVAF